MSLKPLGLVVLVACGGKPPPITNPDFSPIPTKPSARGKLYADCLAEAVASQHYGHAQDDGSTNVLLFTCTGAPARAFFEGLGSWSKQQSSEVKADGKVIRSTNRVRKNLFGVDYCASDGAIYECVVTLNVGDFARQ